MEKRTVPNSNRCTNRNCVIKSESFRASGICDTLCSGVIENCINYSNVEGKSYSSGICAVDSLVNTPMHFDITITNCSNYGNVTSGTTTSVAGGILGISVHLDTTVQNCNNYGEISGKNRIGGIVGMLENGYVKNCNNYGEISGIQQIGGIAGSMEENVYVKNCSNTGKIISTAGTANGIGGGIVGYMSNGEISNVYNSGEVNVGNNASNDRNGGIAGHIENGKISNAYNKGVLIGGDYIGGIVGRKADSAITENSYYYSPDNSLFGIGGTNSDTNNIAVRTNKDINSLSDFLKSTLP